MSFILAGVIVIGTILLAYMMLLAGPDGNPTFKKGDVVGTLLVGLLTAAGMAATHWIGW